MTLRVEVEAEGAEASKCGIRHRDLRDSKVSQRFQRAPLKSRSVNHLEASLSHLSSNLQLHSVLYPLAIMFSSLISEFFSNSKTEADQMTSLALLFLCPRSRGLTIARAGRTLLILRQTRYGGNRQHLLFSRNSTFCIARNRCLPLANGIEQTLAQLQL